MIKDLVMTTETKQKKNVLVVIFLLELMTVDVHVAD